MIMADDTYDTALVGRIDAQPGAKVVIVSKLVGSIYMGEPTPARTAEQRNRLATIKRVRADWIDGLLKNSLNNVARIELNLAAQEDAVEWGVQAIVQFPDREHASYAPGIDMAEIFDQSDQSLLILGDPGTGKTTLLLELAKTLLERAEHDESQPIPIVFNLSGWAVKRKPLALWMVDEMNERTDVPKRLGSEWIGKDAVIPLLDGLDEVGEEHRTACLEAINDFRREHGLLPIAVCSRSAEYERLRLKLRLRNAVVVQGLGDVQVEAALARNPDLVALRAAVKQDSSLAELLRTPLMLWIAALAYRNFSGQIATGENAEQMRKRLFGAYVEAMFKRRGASRRYSRPDTLRWLGWLARALRERELTIFSLEGLDWKFLPGRTFRWVSTCAGLLGVAVIYGIWCFAVAWIAYQLSYPLLLICAHFPSLHITHTGWRDQETSGLIIGFYQVIILGPIGAIIALLSDLKPAEKLEFSFRELKRRVKPAILIAVCSAALMYLAKWILHDDQDFSFVPGSPAGIGLLCGFIRLFLTDASEVRSKSNQGTQRSIRMAMAATGCILLVGLFVAMRDGLHYWIFVASLAGGLAGGLFAVRHHVLRITLWATRVGPLRYVSFLNYACDRVFLRKVGGGYVFTHRMLMEYFALSPDLGRTGAPHDEESSLQSA